MQHLFYFCVQQEIRTLTLTLEGSCATINTNHTFVEIRGFEPLRTTLSV